MQQSHPPVYSREQLQRVEKHAMQSMGISEYELMQRAANAAFHWVAQRKNDKMRCLVLVGTGNNGGDGLVFARRWQEVGRTVKVIAVEHNQVWKGDAAKQAHADFLASGAHIDHQAADVVDLDDYDLVVDALLGTGVNRDVDAEYAAWIEKLNAHAITTLSLDTPSGIDADSGERLGSAVNADITISFIANKAGFFLNDGPNCVGKLICDDLGIAKSAFAQVGNPVMRQESGEDHMHYLSSRQRTFHKGNAGYVLVVGGNSGFSGATILSGLAALRTGAGLVSIAAHPDSVTAIRAVQPELMVHGITQADDIEPLFERAAVVVVGPGLGQDKWAQAILDKVLQSGKPLVVDADGLNLLAKKPIQNDQWVLTPHPGEAARMLEMSTKQVQAKRLDNAQALHEKFAGVIVLKGANSLIASENDVPTVCAAGNPGMATAGMGDVLTGVIGSLMAQGIPLLDAAKLGVWLHASAGDLAAEQGERGMIASDVLPYLRRLVNP